MLKHTALPQAYTALAAAAGVFQDTFARLHAQHIVPDVLYPAVQVPSDDDLEAARSHWQQHLSSELTCFATSAPLFVSINRFERKKVGVSFAVVQLAVKLALSALQTSQSCKAPLYRASGSP